MNYGLYQFSTIRVEQKYRKSSITRKTNGFFLLFASAAVQSFDGNLLTSVQRLVLYWQKPKKGRIFPQWFMWWLSRTTVPFRPNFFSQCRRPTNLRMWISTLSIIFLLISNQDSLNNKFAWALWNCPFWRILLRRRWWAGLGPLQHI